MIRIWVLFLLILPSFFFSSYLFAQKNIESKLLSQLKLSKSQTEQIRILNDLNAYYKNQNLNEHRKIVKILKQKKNKTLSNSDKLIVDINLLENLMEEKKLNEFRRQFERIDYSNIDDPVLFQRYQILKINYYYFFEKGNYLELAKNLVFKAKKSRKNQLISEAYMTLSQAFSFRNLSDSAFVYGKLASDYSGRSDSKITVANSLHNQAKIYSFFGKNNDAVSKEMEFLQVASELQNDFLRSLANLDIALNLLEVDNLEGAKNYFRRSEQIGQKYLDEHQTLRLKLGQLLCDIKLGNIQESQAILSKLKNRINKLQNTELTGFQLFISGELKKTENKWVEAIQEFNKAIQCFKNLNDSQKIAEIYQEIARCFIKLKRHQDAELAVLLSLENNSRLSENKSNENNKLLAEIYESLNNLSKAYKYQKMFLENEQRQNISKDAVAMNVITESNLREERERFIETQKISISIEKAAKEKLETQRTRNLLISIIVAIILVLGLIILFLRTKQIRSRQDQREAEMSQALLRTQMNPHFVFNAMSVIQSYIFTHNPEKSSKFLVNFSKLMRLILENSPKEFIPLELEEEILEKYLNTQKLRFEGRFEFELLFDEELLFQKAMVPPMITQPFVENAIEHGQLHTVENGKITISARQKDQMLEIIVCDNGIGRKNSSNTKKIKTHKSMAINMTRERIEILNRKYRSTGNLTIEDFDKKTGRGTEVTIQLPLKFE
jgi:hypothetical protein